MLRSSLTALTAAALTATALAQHTPVAPAANPRPPRAFVHALSEGSAVWADGTLGPVETDRSVGSAAPGDGTTLQVGSRVFTTGFGTRASSVITFEVEGDHARGAGPEARRERACSHLERRAVARRRATHRSVDLHGTEGPVRPHRRSGAQRVDELQRRPRTRGRRDGRALRQPRRGERGGGERCERVPEHG